MNENTNDERQADLEKLLKELAVSANVCDDERKRAEIIKRFCEIYQGTWRHRYSSFFSVLMDLFGEDDEKLEILSGNLKIIAEEGKFSEDAQKKIRKLQDHINLEMARIMSWFGEQKDIQEKYANLKKQVDEVESRNQKLKEELDSHQINYITILGIFASIVLAFAGSISFSNSVFSSIANASIYQIGTACLLQGFVFVNLIYILVLTVLRNLKPSITELLQKHIKTLNYGLFFALIIVQTVSIFSK